MPKQRERSGITTSNEASLGTILADSKGFDLNQREETSLHDICMRCERLRLQGREHIAARQWVEATRVYREAICVIMGKDFEVPGWSRNCGMIMQRYIEITDWQRIALMQCCNGIVQSRAMLDDLQGVRNDIFMIRRSSCIILGSRMD